ncbi:MAG: hypothetical protein IJ662_03510 [Clostridia bacterium]|nr:hypothetical protein [Clostridia bacterium]
MKDTAEYAVVWDIDLTDRYIAEIVEHGRFGANPLCKVITILSYPIQHAILYRDVANENAPYPCGAITRLTVIRPISADEARKAPPYPEALKAALSAALDAARVVGDGPVIEILERHANGEYRKKRLIFKRR